MHDELVSLGEVSVIAPETAQSATGHGITLHTPLLTQPVKTPTFTGIAVDGRPADCVKVAIAHLFKGTPDLVVSGMNAGANVGINVIYSGTVAAAIEAAFLGAPAIAVSLHLSRSVKQTFPRAAQLAMPVITDLLRRGIRGGEVWSINIPAIDDTDEPRGVKFVRQCTRPWAETYIRRQDPRGNDYFWNGSEFILGQSERDTDVAAIRDKFISVTPLMFDLTQHGRLREMQGLAT